MAPLFVEARSSNNVTRELSRAERLQQLERIVSSSHFRNSKRYPSFLRYVVERTVDEDDEILKERNLGVEIFGRPSDYDTNSDPIVRVTAGEVRKRIAQYYQTAGHEHELRIDLPLGCYVPHFSMAHPTEQVPEQSADPERTVPLNELQQEPKVASPGKDVLFAVPVPVQTPAVSAWPRRSVLSLVVAISLALLVAAYALFSFLHTRSQAAGIEYFWQSFTPPAKNALIVIGTHSLDSAGKPVSADSHVSLGRDNQQSALASMEASDMIPLSDIVSYSKLTDLLTRRSLPYRTMGSSETTVEELRNGPVILIGGFNNIWTMRLTSALRYRLVPEGSNVNSIVDSRDPSKVWLFDNLQPAFSNLPDYAIVASYFDTTIEQHVIIAAGIGKNGTVAASEFLSTDEYLKNWLAEAKVPRNKNMELVLSTNVMDGQPGPPHVVAFTTW